MKSIRPTNEVSQNSPASWANLRLQIEYRSPVDLKTYHRRLRKADERLVADIMRSLGTFGCVSPLLIDANDVVVDGEKVAEAAKRLGIAEIPVVRLEHLSPEEVRLLRLNLNQLQTQGEWDLEQLSVEFGELLKVELPVSVAESGFSLAQIDGIVFGKAAVGKQEPEIPGGPDVARLGDLWLLGGQRIFCGSSLERESFEILMGNERAQMVFTDSPYNVKIAGNVSGLGKKTHRDFVQGVGEFDEDGFIEFQTSYIRNLADFCEDGSLLYLCMDHRHMWEIQSGIRANGLAHVNLAIWNKLSGAMGSFLRSQHELIFIVKKGKAPHRNNVRLGANGRNRSNIFDFPGMSRFGKGRDDQLALHSTCKPVPLVAECILDVTDKGEIVLDCFLGSGTTLIAAERTGRLCRGMELDPLYVDVAIRRWQAMTDQDAVLAATGQTFRELELGRLQPASAEISPKAIISPRPRSRAI
ncbi:DNA modification methylase [Rhizorhabdus dicambivorans]|uniref:Methyltransferase n=1 Tax=Rhizorhabdus dicambivorans TaxID=1850238 RepID=A0A2A4FWF5_9SPHN|nr:DNA modification methylase [Rhizorhabdus dicambivorans]ATE66200.1 DNA methylase N-4 [Rhizorhabdus dicambivorans]PCE41711.1 DNA methylase N-4 [Rhizorhabdus dicambivorans]